MHKRYINDDLQKTIQRQLIKTRQPEQPFLDPMDVVRDALRLPLNHKNLRALESRNDLLQRFDNDEFFDIFSPELLVNIEAIIEDIFFESGKNLPIGCKKSYLFVGNSENHLMVSHEVRNNFTLLMRDRTKKYHRDYFISRALNRKEKRRKTYLKVYQRYTHGVPRCFGTSKSTFFYWCQMSEPNQRPTDYKVKS